MLSGTLLNLLERLGMDVLTLTYGLSEEEFFASRIARKRTLELLGNMSKTAIGIPQEVKLHMADVDWAAWAVLSMALASPERHPLQIWVTVQELVPLTVQRLGDCRKRMPQLFSVVP
jgi:uncharacterized protein with HEPN domain